MNFPLAAAIARCAAVLLLAGCVGGCSDDTAEVAARVELYELPSSAPSWSKELVRQSQPYRLEWLNFLHVEPAHLAIAVQDPCDSSSLSTKLAWLDRSDGHPVEVGSAQLDPNAFDDDATVSGVGSTSVKLTQLSSIEDTAGWESAPFEWQVRFIDLLSDNVLVTTAPSLANSDVDSSRWRLTNLRRRDGAELWSQQFTGELNSLSFLRGASPSLLIAGFTSCIVGDGVASSCPGSSLLSIDGETGALVRAADAGACFENTSLADTYNCLASGRIVVAHAGEDSVATDLQSGDVLWQRTTSTWLVGIEAGRVYFLDDVSDQKHARSRLSALALQTGEELWSATFELRVMSAQLSQGRLALAARTYDWPNGPGDGERDHVQQIGPNQLIVLDAATGSESFRRELSSDPNSDALLLLRGTALLVAQQDRTATAKCVR